MTRIKNKEGDKEESNDEKKDDEQPVQNTIVPLPSRKTEDEIPFDIIIECDLSLRRKLNMLSDKEK
jgi:hypothetical protein